MQRIHVMAAVLMDGESRILIAKRPQQAHQGGLWEFPGGKREAGESREQALARELTEEIGIVVLAAQPLISVAHDYPDRQVLLDVWRVTRWQGEVAPCEGQPLAWVDLGSLAEFNFPQADRPVLKALSVPQRYLITPPPGPDGQMWLAELEASLTMHIRLLQIRAPKLQSQQFEALVREAIDRVHRHNTDIRVLVNTEPEIARQCGADGVHLNQQRLWAFTHSTQSSTGLLLGASCHSRADLQQAATIGADFAVLSPVLPTRSHPGAPALGWHGFAALVSDAQLPVYALGGMAEVDLPKAIRAGAQGIAGIRGFWSATVD